MISTRSKDSVGIIRASQLNLNSLVHGLKEVFELRKTEFLQVELEEHFLLEMLGDLH